MLVCVSLDACAMLIIKIRRVITLPVEVENVCFWISFRQEMMAIRLGEKRIFCVSRANFFEMEFPFAIDTDLNPQPILLLIPPTMIEEYHVHQGDDVQNDTLMN